MFRAFGRRAAARGVMGLMPTAATRFAAADGPTHDRGARQGAHVLDNQAGKNAPAMADSATELALAKAKLQALKKQEADLEEALKNAMKESQTRGECVEDAAFFAAIHDAALSDELSPSSRMRTLTLPDGFSWPCDENHSVCFVRAEYDQLVGDFLKNLKRNVVVVGQPGIGKSFLGGYALHRFLKAGHTVIYAIRENVYVFDAEKKTATKYPRRQDYDRVLFKLPDAILIHDCERNAPDPPTGKTARVFVVSSPMEQQFKSFRKQTKARPRCVDLWSDDELKAACAVLKLDEKTVMERRFELGPMPRHCFSEDEAEVRREAIKGAIGDLARSSDDVLGTLLTVPASDEHPSHKLMMMKKLPEGSGSHYVYLPCPNVMMRLYQEHARKIQRTDAAWLQLVQNCDRGWQGTTFEQLYAPTLLYKGVLAKLLQNKQAVVELTDKRDSLPTIPDDLKGIQLPAKLGSPQPLVDDTLYWSESKSFAVVDWFVVHDGNFVGLKFTDAGTRAPNATSIGGMYNTFADAFGKDEWNKIKRWSIVYVQRPIDTRMQAVQELKLNFRGGEGRAPSQCVPYDQAPKTPAEHTPAEARQWNEWAETQWGRFSQFTAAPS